MENQENLSILNIMLKEMDIPENRRELTFYNLLWLQRNLGIRNFNHEDFTMAMILINRYVRNAENEKVNIKYRKNKN